MTPLGPHGPKPPHVKRALARATIRAGIRSWDKQLTRAGRDLLRKSSPPDSAAGSKIQSDTSAESLTPERTKAEIFERKAEDAAQRITRNVICDLEKMTDTLSSDDSGLETTWDEICIQIQHEESPFWFAYDEIVRGMVGGFVAELSDNEREAIWLQTDAGIDWNCEEPDVREPNPVNQDEIVDYLVRDVYSKAADWSNERIDAYFARSYESD
jgi:hypothetical protein